MKHLLNFRPWLLLFASVCLLLGCDEDSPYGDIKQSDGIVTRKISLEELKERPKAYQKMLQYLDRGTNSKSTRKNNVYNSKYEFTINTDEIIYTEKGDYHSYTFSIYSDDDKGYVENLFLHLQPDGSYTAFLIQYDLSEDDRAAMKGGKGINNLNTKTVFYPLPDFDSDTVLQSRGCLQSMTVSCTYQVTVTTTPKAQGDLVGCNDPDCLYDYIYTYTLIDCTFSSTGCGGFETSGSVYDMFNGAGGSGPKLANQPIIGISVSDDAKHIRELNRISNRKGTPNPLRDRIDGLVTDLSTATEEKGWEVRKGPDGTYIYMSPLSVGYDHTSFLPPINTTILYLHLHHNSTFIDEEGQENSIDPVPSGPDFFGFARAIDILNELNAPDKDNLTSMIITRNGVYAMRVGDPDEAVAFSTNTPNDPEIQKKLGQGFYDDVTEKGRDIAASQCSGCSPEELKEMTDIEVEKAFTQYMQDFNIKYHTGIKVFKGTLDPGSGNYIWTKIID